MPPPTSLRPLSPNTLEHEMIRIRDALAIKESEDSWDTIAKGVQALTNLVGRGADNIPHDILLTLRSLSHPINSAVLSERSRLSAAAVELLTTSATELGSAFDSLLPVFLPTLLSLCARTNKVFISRARTCIVAIIQSTQSPLILSYLCRSMKDKSNTLRLIIAECALACLNSFNPPDLQKEARSREIELLIKWAATDANAEVRKYGKQMYEAYQILLPERVESFTAPLTPTMRKYLNVASKPRSHPSQSSNPSTSRPASALSIRSGLGGSTSSTSSRPTHSRAQTPCENPSGPLVSSSSSSVLGESSSSTQSAVSQNSRYRILRSQSRVDLTSSDSSRQKPAAAPNSNMPPPDYIPSRSQRNQPPQAPQRPASAQEGANTGNHPSQRQKVGPIRPSQYPPPSQPSQTAADTVGAKRPAGARRVPLPEPPPAKEVVQEEQREAKGPVRPASVCEPRELETHKGDTRVPPPAAKKTESKAKSGTLRAAASHSALKQKEHKPQDRDARHDTQRTGRSKQPAQIQPSRPLDNGKHKERERARAPTSLPAAKGNSRQAAPSKVPELSHVTRRPVKEKQSVAKKEAVAPVKVEPAALVPLPPSPMEPSTPTHTGMLELPITIVSHTPEEHAEEVTPLPAVVFDTVTPKPAPSAIPAFMVQQTPISALVDSIRAGFVFSPNAADSTFGDDDEEEGSSVLDDASFDLGSVVDQIAKWKRDRDEF
ncbi:hypothetical protein EIP86_004888 [Pleurotus ostreatoroseus]|nr:hypothetical protein EIP86_004888 [Pleurotus ostreatoroseus]